MKISDKIEALLSEAKQIEEKNLKFKACALGRGNKELRDSFTDKEIDLKAQECVDAWHLIKSLEDLQETLKNKQMFIF